MKRSPSVLAYWWALCRHNHDYSYFIAIITQYYNLYKFTHFQNEIQNHIVCIKFISSSVSSFGLNSTRTSLRFIASACRRLYSTYTLLSNAWHLKRSYPDSRTLIWRLLSTCFFTVFSLSEIQYPTTVIRSKLTPIFKFCPPFWTLNRLLDFLDWVENYLHMDVLPNPRGMRWNGCQGAFWSFLQLF